MGAGRGGEQSAAELRLRGGNVGRESFIGGERADEREEAGPIVGCGGADERGDAGSPGGWSEKVE
jgi:hypothetical protein